MQTDLLQLHARQLLAKILLAQQDEGLGAFLHIRVLDSNICVWACPCSIPAMLTCKG